MSLAADLHPVLGAPLATAEFLVVDTETNGLGGDACEVTEVGAVLVGGGELHDRWEALVPVRMPLSRGIQRFTGITQDMVDAAPPAETTLPELGELLEGRVLVGHNVSFDARVLRQAFGRAELEWPEPPTLCTVALARALHPLARQRKLKPLAESLGIEVEVSHRALADAETCARVLCALFPRLCANAGSVGEALGLLRSKRRSGPGRGRAGRTDGGPSLQGARRRKIDLSHLPDEPGVYLFRNAEGQPLYVGKSISIRKRARAHLAPSSPDTAWIAQVEVVDHQETQSELGALLLEHRLIRELRPPGNVRMKHDDRYVYVRCRLDIAFPVLEVAPEPAAGRAVNIGPLLGRHAATELVEQLNSLFALRHCGRTLPKRPWPSAYGQMGRCLSPCLGDLDPNAYRGRLDEALALFTGSGDAGAALLRRVDRQVREAAAEERFERAGWLRRRRDRLAVLLERLGDGLSATHAHPRLVLAAHPEHSRYDALWVVGGRVAHWCAVGPAPSATLRVEPPRAAAPAASPEGTLFDAPATDPATLSVGEWAGLDVGGSRHVGAPALTAGDVAARTAAVLRGGDGRGTYAVATADEVREARVVSLWLAAHPSLELPLAPAPRPREVEAFARRALSAPSLAP